MAFSAFLFDYNGVLVDDERVHLTAFSEVLHPLGITISEGDYTSKYLGYDDVGAFQAILSDHGRTFDNAQIEALVQAKKPKYLALARRELATFAGAGKLLQRLSAQGAVIGIVSGALREEIELGLQVLQVRSAIQFIVSAEDTRHCKPHPEGYLLGLAQLTHHAGPATKHSPLVIEDSLAGVAAATAAQLPCIAVAHSYSEVELAQAGATQVVARIADITDGLLTELSSRLHAMAT